LSSVLPALYLLGSLRSHDSIHHCNFHIFRLGRIGATGKPRLAMPEIRALRPH
jgi:hypothetical protein